MTESQTGRGRHAAGKHRESASREPYNPQRQSGTGTLYRDDSTLDFGRPPRFDDTVDLGPPQTRRSWADQVTQALYTGFTSDTSPHEQPLHSQPTPGELMNAGMDGAATARLFLASPNERDRLEPLLTPKDDPTEKDLMYLFGAHCQRLGLSPHDQRRIYHELARRPEYISDFLDAFSGAKTIATAIDRLPWQHAAQGRSR